MDDTQSKARIDQIYRSLDAYSYFDLLNLTPEAPLEDIRKAFHQAALTMHPDRHEASADAVLRRQVYCIYFFRRAIVQCAGTPVSTIPKYFRLPPVINY